MIHFCKSGKCNTYPALPQFYKPLIKHVEGQTRGSLESRNTLKQLPVWDNTIVFVTIMQLSLLLFVVFDTHTYTHASIHAHTHTHSSMHAHTHTQTRNHPPHTHTIYKTISL